MAGFVQWLYSLCWEIGEYIINLLMDVFSMDMAFFEKSVPVAQDISNIMLGVGWALLLGNLVFQAVKTMMSGIGFEGEDPKLLFTRTFVFAFLLLASRQICNLGLGLTSTVIELLQVPNSVILPEFQFDMFAINASWLLVVIIGLIIVYQLVKFFFEVGERYVIVAVLTILAPLAFGMGGSRNTNDIFKGWCRMYGSMCLMMALNVVFMKMLVSAAAIRPNGAAIFPWLILIVALARVARKIDHVIARIGLNPAITGDGLGKGFPGMLAYMAGRNLVNTFTRTSTTGGGAVHTAFNRFAGSRNNTNSHSSSAPGSGASVSAPQVRTSQSVRNAGQQSYSPSTNTLHTHQNSRTDSNAYSQFSRSAQNAATHNTSHSQHVNASQATKNPPIQRGQEPAVPGKPQNLVERYSQATVHPPARAEKPGVPVVPIGTRNPVNPTKSEVITHDRGTTATHRDSDKPGSARGQSGPNRPGSLDGRDNRRGR